MSASPRTAATDVVESSEFQIPGGKIVLILCGLVASGKSTFAIALQKHYPQFRRCNQDDLGDRRAVEQLARQTLNQGLSICIDRTNFNAAQRSYWIKIAREFPGTEVWVIVFDTPYEICAERLRHRAFHPTIKSPEQGLSILSRFYADFQYPATHEGFQRILYVKPSDHSSPVYTRSDITETLMRVKSSSLIPTPGSHRGNYGTAHPSARGNSLRGRHNKWQTPNHPVFNPTNHGRGRENYSNVGPTNENQLSPSHHAKNLGINGTECGQVRYPSGVHRDQGNSIMSVGQGSGSIQDPFVIE
ncbi:Transcription factor bHLH140 [Psilocybe cubensis]|uniref:P-loop containing nucleoside triphosphate hydrolase protein n=2 Tax=Psilocybe cubensis TaxID=181762 RepID=A0A8H8CIF5_PSICU|nr:Transcription factor bHLH140 [Psilocybe cubensis]KAH9479653.1 Transcription factor bHLH140 [Psilocybe cubensis]